MVRILTFVAVGDKVSQKTELLFKYTHGKKYYKDYMNPPFQNNIQDVIVDGTPYSIYFIDAECDEDYSILRRNSIETADCVLLCYSIGNRQTFQNLYKKWCIEVRKCSPLVPIVLVGTGIEIRNDENVECVVTTEEGDDFKYLIGASAFVECSVEKFTGVDNVFINAVRSTYRIK